MAITFRRRLILCTMILFLFGFPIGGWWAWYYLAIPLPVRAYNRIRLGMAASTVEAALTDGNGYSKTTFSTDLVRFYTCVNRKMTINEAAAGDEIAEDLRAAGFTGEIWISDSYWILVVYDADLTVKGLCLHEATCLTRPGIYEQIRMLLAGWI